jgi:hypothetical protein
MKRLLGLILLAITLTWFLAKPIFATYEQAYQDFLFQFDGYRQKYSDFQVAKNEYLKFKTLTSEATALEKTKAMMTQRDQLLRSYLLVLYEKLNDPNSGLTQITREQHQKILGNEIAFLETHAQTIGAIGSIEDAEQVSKELESHYIILQTSIRQILIGLSLGQLAIIAKHYDTLVTDSQAIISQHAGTFTPQKQETINRWVLQIVNKRNFYQQKVDSISQQSAAMDASDEDDLDTQYNTLVRGMAEARQYLVEGISNLTELRDALKYAN